MSNIHDHPHHISVTPADLDGNNGIGRYILLPGSDGRAKQIAESFSHVVVKEHPRGHHCYLGTIQDGSRSIDVATISSGMGCPSMEIILHELFHQGGKRFLRVGTAGSLQPDLITIGDIVSAQASVRDEQTTLDYVPPEVPAIASTKMLRAIEIAADKNKLGDKLHTGLVHCKSSFYAREFYVGPKAGLHKEYMETLVNYGVLASEMETAALFIQAQLYNYLLSKKGSGPQSKVLAGAVLGIAAVPPELFMTAEQEKPLTETLIQLALAAIKELASAERC